MGSVPCTIVSDYPSYPPIGRVTQRRQYRLGLLTLRLLPRHTGCETSAAFDGFRSVYESLIAIGRHYNSHAIAALNGQTILYWFWIQYVLASALIHVRDSYHLQDKTKFWFRHRTASSLRNESYLLSPRSFPRLA